MWTHIPTMTAFSLLDLVPIVQGGTLRAAFAQSVDLARHAERLGYTRYWVAEHHGMAGIASAATALTIANVAAATATIRVGAGGIMLPNHAPLVIAEQFGTLDALYPGRIDLGLGRAPGSDQRVARALRRTLATDPNAFPQDVLELQGYFANDGQTGIVATPGAGADVQLWILGSSTFGAQVAAALGLPYAFASHFAPQALDQAIAVYREQFRPSAVLAKPHVAVGFNIFAADTDAEAALIASSAQQSFVSIRTGDPIQLPPPVPGYREQLDPHASYFLDSMLSAAAIGSPETVADQVDAFLRRTQADELIIASMVYDPEARKRSIAIAAQVMRTRK